MTQGFLTINDLKLWYEDTGGAGKAITLLHAGVCDHRQWDDQVSALAERYRVIRYDLPGMGESEAKPGKVVKSELLRSVLDTLGVQQTALMGCSMGGSTVLDFAVTYPERVGALITVGAGVSGAPEHESSPEQVAVVEEAMAAQKAGDWNKLNELEARYWLQGFARAADQVRHEAMRRFREMNDNNNRRFAAGEVEGLELGSIEPPAYGRLNVITAPTLVIIGSGDETEVVAMADDIANGIPGARKQVMAGLGHVPNLDEPEEFNRIILDFLQPVW